ncbi:MAG: hypothetical protein NZ694_06490, partial [Tepidimonas sp.]|nr:hypothetical protein [Tepidimonas sp.]
IPGETPMAALCAFYGWPPVADERMSVAQWFEQHATQQPIEGDQLRWGPAELSVRRLREGTIERIGIRIDDEASA